MCLNVPNNPLCPKAGNAQEKGYQVRELIIQSFLVRRGNYRDGIDQVI